MSRIDSASQRPVVSCAFHAVENFSPTRPYVGAITYTRACVRTIESRATGHGDASRATQRGRLRLSEEMHGASSLRAGLFTERTNKCIRSNMGHSARLDAFDMVHQKKKRTAIRDALSKARIRTFIRCNFHRAASSDDVAGRR